MTPAELLDELVRRRQTVAVAESLTGGLLAAALIEPAGASRVFRGGLIVYATDLKASLAGVPTRLLAARGAVDPAVAVTLAEGARERCGADWGLGTTGVAGPDPQDGKPVGMVFVAVAGPDSSVWRGHTFTGSRLAIRRAAVQAVLDLFAQRLAANERSA